MYMHITFCVCFYVHLYVCIHTRILLHDCNQVLMPVPSEDTFIM